MNDDQILLYTIAEILLEVNLPLEKKERIRNAMCGIYAHAPEPTEATNVTVKSKRFEVPAISDVKSHMESLKVVNAERHSAEFWHFYESKGWMVGKNKMKNWKSAASRWCMELPRGGSEQVKKRIIV
jgi:hypothetical protein